MSFGTATTLFIPAKGNTFGTATTIFVPAKGNTFGTSIDIGDLTALRIDFNVARADGITEFSACAPGGTGSEGTA